MARSISASRELVTTPSGKCGAERAGGWNALTWDTGIARTAKDNIRTWGQLGLTGEWADRPIHPYAPPRLGAGAITYFQIRVFGGAEIWNESLREYADRKQMLADLARDPHGIAYAPAAYANPGVKILALGETKAGPHVTLDRASVQARTYPLHRPVYVYYTVDNANNELMPTLGDPRVKEFIRYILSKQGQQDVAGEGSYLPLPATVAQAYLNGRCFALQQLRRHHVDVGVFGGVGPRVPFFVEGLDVSAQEFAQIFVIYFVLNGFACLVDERLNRVGLLGCFGWRGARCRSCA